MVGCVESLLLSAIRMRPLFLDAFIDGAAKRGDVREHKDGFVAFGELFHQLLQGDGPFLGGARMFLNRSLYCLRWAPVGMVKYWLDLFLEGGCLFILFLGIQLSYLAGHPSHRTRT